MLNQISESSALPMVLHVDNQAALNQMASKESSLKAKVDFRPKFLCDYA
uniref:Uncharacterized protein n=1 Tax=Peronospora matthiolae TaxID=2874970 RepID=A0AAV1V032_9STRA